MRIKCAYKMNACIILKKKKHEFIQTHRSMISHFVSFSRCSHWNFSVSFSHWIFIQGKRLYHRLDCCRLSHTLPFISHRILKFKMHYIFWIPFFLKGGSTWNKTTSLQIGLLQLYFVCHRWNNNGKVVCNLLHEKNYQVPIPS